ncbi:MAG: hypothetical protein HY854_22720 [Burkholderiales bacterium]|nr:hypothetical protein [Burkholderiales bacterium]
MTNERIASTANQLIDGFDTTAHHLIEAWLDGSERLGAAARQRWDAAFEQAKPQLSAETRKNATHARKVLGGYYTRGTEMTASGAAIAVDTVVQAARVAVERAAQWPQARA